MIERQYIKTKSEFWLNDILNKPNLDSIKAKILERGVWDGWIERLHVRVNQLDLAGYIRSKYALDQFLKSATVFYAEKQLAKMELSGAAEGRVSVPSNGGAHVSKEVHTKTNQDP